MTFSKWFKGYGANNELQAEVDKLRKESGSYAERYERLQRSLDDFAAKKDQLLSVIDHLHKKLDEKDLKMASFVEEIARLKKLISEQRQSANNISIPPTEPAFMRTIGVTQEPVTPEQKQAIEKIANVWRKNPDLVKRTVGTRKAEGVKGKGNERTRTDK